MPQMSNTPWLFFYFMLLVTLSFMLSQNNTDTPLSSKPMKSLNKKNMNQNKW